VETALRGGGGLVSTLRHSYSVNDLRSLSPPRRVLESRRNGDVFDDKNDKVILRKRRTSERSMARSWHESQRAYNLQENTNTRRVNVNKTQSFKSESPRPRSMLLQPIDDERDSAMNNMKENFPRRRKSSEGRNLRPVSLYATLPSQKKRRHRIKEDIEI